MNNIIIDSIRREHEYTEIFKTMREQINKKKPLPLLVTGLSEGARVAFYVALASDMKKLYGKGFLLVVPDEKQAVKIINACTALNLNVLNYPMRDFVFHNITASHEFEHERLSVLSAVISHNYDIIVTTPDAALQYTIPKDILIDAGLTIKKCSEYNMNKLIAFLDRSGYIRVDMVNGAGQYSVRGGIIDVFPPKCEYPVRAEFFGDDIEQLEIFDILTQRRIENIVSVEITPAREILLNFEKKDELKKVITAQVKKSTDNRIHEILCAELEAIEADTELNFIDKYISLVYPEKFCFLDYFDDVSIMITEEWNAVFDRLKSFEWHARQSLTELLEEGSLSSRFTDFNKWSVDYEKYAENRPSIIVDTFAAGMTGRHLSGIFNIASKQTVSYSDSIDLLREDLTNYLRSGYSVVLICENETMAKNLRSLLSDNGINVLITDGTSFQSGIPCVIFGKNIQGFELTASRFTVMTMYANSNYYSRSITALKHKTNIKRSVKEKIMSYADLNIGDYVVHANHGIGQYLGLQSLTVDGVIKDFVKIKYAGTDMLYLPTNQLDMVSKYIGAHSEDGILKLSRMGSAEWHKAKSRVKAAAKSMAKELIKLYAERMRLEGFSFYSDDEYQREFEDAFEFEETSGQLIAVEEIKKDMEKITPMDRLLCGDVGFGKTEVALRAAFKAVSSSKQVGILVPTTILALQHYQTLLSRMRGFPVNVDMLSRFRNSRQQQETIRRLRRGEIDIIVGTHRLLSKDIIFKDLGLVIIDEEQRFGVTHKEKLKLLAHNIDSLTLTATPIPRTLNMAMSGIRDMSILEEAPGDRIPVQTYVLEYDELIIADAIKKELRRGGQVFFLHNRIDTINQTASRIAQMVPDAKIAVTHGKIDKEELSDIWHSLVIGEVDILITTTIIETGIDVPNANTLIIERADNLGLSQLHQIRGRVGRSSRRAYAYFTYPKGIALTEIAEKRLMAIRDYTEFGSGFKIALRDLEIRGAGNLLGAEQHGHIDTIGYDLYMKLLNEAILEEKGESLLRKSECSVDLSFDAYIPEKYIHVSTQRIDAYKKIAAIENDDDLNDIRDELTDRYGEMPKPVDNLLLISLIRAMGCFCNIAKIEQHDGSIIIRPELLNSSVWAAVAANFKGRLMLNVSAKPYISYRIKKGDQPLDFICEMFKKYIQISIEKL